MVPIGLPPRTPSGTVRHHGGDRHCRAATGMPVAAESAIIMTALSEVDIFQDFPPGGLERLAAEGQSRTFAVGEPLLRQGSISEAMYIILSGRVRKERSHPLLTEPAAILELGP